VSDLLVQEPGPLTTIQDLGRFGHLRVGIPTSGPMDRDAFVLANRLVGNPDGAAALECTVIGARIELTDDRLVAVTGADMPPTVNGAAVPAWQAAPTTPSRAPASSQTPAGATSWPRLSPGLASEPALLPAARATPDRPPAAAKPAASRAAFAVHDAHVRMGTPCSDTDARGVVRGVASAASPSTGRNLNITRSTHGVQNAELRSAPAIQPLPRATLTSV